MFQLINFEMKCVSHTSGKMRVQGEGEGVEAEYKGGGEPRAACKIVLYCTAIKINVIRNEFPTLYEMQANSF